MTEQPENAGRFPTTMWTLIGRAGQGTAAQQEALNELLIRYLPALKAHLVFRKRIVDHDADDLLQNFVENKILERDLIAAADANRGRFRSFLLKSLDNFARNEFEKRTAAKRTMDHAPNIENESVVAAKASEPSRAFDVAWARQVLGEVVENMRQECRRSRREDLWQVFQLRVLKPITEGCEPVGYDEIVARLQFANPTQACDALKTSKRMFARNLRSVVSRYATDEDELEQEIRELGEALAETAKL